VFKIIILLLFVIIMFNLFSFIISFKVLVLVNNLFVIMAYKSNYFYKNNYCRRYYLIKLH